MNRDTMDASDRRTDPVVRLNIDDCTRTRITISCIPRNHIDADNRESIEKLIPFHRTAE